MSLRLSAEMADEIAAVARTDSVSISDAVRTAIATHISTRRTDPDFQQRLKQRLREQREVLEAAGYRVGVGRPLTEEADPVSRRAAAFRQH